MPKDTPKKAAPKKSTGGAAGWTPEVVAAAQAQGTQAPSGVRLEHMVSKPVDTTATGGMHPFMLPVGVGQPYLAARGPLPGEGKPPGPIPPGWEQPAPQGMGGLDLGGIAQGARAETNTRIQGQSSLIDQYLSQVLGQANAKNAAAGERDGRMQDFERQRAVMQEALQRSRQGQDSALQRARIEAQAAEGMSDREQRGVMAAEQRAFELGSAAMAQPGEREALENQLLEMQVLQMEQELGGAAGQGYGKYDVSADRGGDLSRGRQDDLRQTTFTEQGSSGGWGPLNIGASDDRTLTYEDLIGSTRGIVDQYGLESESADPIKLRQGLLELARNRPQLASLLLSDIGYNPAAFLAPEG